jgi:hypothetical protein
MGVSCFVHPFCLHYCMVFWLYGKICFNGKETDKSTTTVSSHVRRIRIFVIIHPKSLELHNTISPSDSTIFSFFDMDFFILFYFLFHYYFWLLVRKIIMIFVAVPLMEISVILERCYCVWAPLCKRSSVFISNCEMGWYNL